MEASELFDFSHSICGPFLQSEKRIWEVLPKIQDYLIELAKQLPNSYREVKEKVWVGPNTYIEETALIQGPAIIGANCQIRHAAFIRQNVICGNDVVIGNSTEVKNAILFDGVQIPHFNYVGDSILGHKAHLGAGAILSNFKSTGDEIHIYIDEQKVGSGLNKFGALLGDHVEVGCNSVLFPGTIIGRASIIYPLCPVRGTIAANTIIKNDGKAYLRKEL